MDRNRDTGEWLAFLRTQNSLTIEEEKITTELKTPQFNGDSNTRIEFVRGYYYAPVDGDYTFTGEVDDQLVMEMSEFKNNANPENLKEVLHLEKWGKH